MVPWFSIVKGLEHGRFVGKSWDRPGMDEGEPVKRHFPKHIQFETLRVEGQRGNVEHKKNRNAWKSWNP